MKVIMASVWGLILSVALTSAQETFTSLDRGGKSTEKYPPGLIKFDDGDVTQVLNTYQELSGRTVVRSTALPAAKINIRSQTPLTRVEALQALDSVLAQNGIVMIPQGAKYVKAVARQLAPQECPPLVDMPREELPDCNTYITYIVEVKHQMPRDLVHGIQPFAALPNSILGIDHAGLIVLRDFSSNVRRMLEVLDRIDRPSAPEEAKPKKRKLPKTN